VLTSTQLKFYLVVVFWGALHRHNFLTFLLPSLLASGNIPSLKSEPTSRFLIVTTAEDWAMLQSHAGFLKLQMFMKAIHLEMPTPVEDSNKYLIMSKGHEMASQKAFTDGACGVFLTPDLVLSDGSLHELKRLAAEGKKVVLCAAMRFTQEGCLADMRELCEQEQGSVLSISSGALAEIAYRNMHPETLRYDWVAPFFAENPYSCFFRVPETRSLIVHSFSWAPLLVNYQALHIHHTDTFTKWTMDGDYIYQNFPNLEDVYVVQDSDEILLVSFTPTDDLLGYLAHDMFLSRWYKWWPVVGYYWKIHSIRMVKDLSNMDPLKHRILSRSVRIHDRETSESALAHTEAYAQKVFSSVLGRSTWLERLCVLGVKVLEKLTRKYFSFLYPVSQVEKLAKPMDGAFTNQAGIGMYQMRLIGPLLSAGKWYWEIHSTNLTSVGGLLIDTASIGVVGRRHSIFQEIGRGKDGWGWRGDGKKIHFANTSTYGTVVDQQSEVMIIALDMDTKKIWFGRNGIWFDGGDPGAGKSPAFQGLSAELFPAISSKHGGQGTATMYATVSSHKWSYSPPQGFHSLHEKAGQEI